LAMRSISSAPSVSLARMSLAHALAMSVIASFRRF
jgi:hypothetical protein